MRVWLSPLTWLVLLLPVAWSVRGVIALTTDASFFTGRPGWPTSLLLWAFVAWWWWTFWRNELRIDVDGIHTRAGSHRHFRWDQLVEVGWIRSKTGAAIVDRPTGGRWDDPGPNSPLRLRALASVGRDAHSGAAELLQQWCERHEVTFTPDGRTMR